MKNSIAIILWLASLSLLAQPTFPTNGPKNEQTRQYALVNVTLFVDYQTKIENATLLVKNDKVVYAGVNKPVEKTYTVIDCKGKFIYPAFIDMVSNYGIQTPLNHTRNEQETKQFTSVKKGAYNWNEAIKAEVNGVDYFSGDEKKAQSLREYGFATVLTGLQDGIFRGSSTLVFTSKEKDQELILLEKAAVGFSFDKGSSKQIYPSSLMGSVALIRQTYYDAKWYANQKTEVNLTLKAFNQLQQLPAIFSVNNKLNVLRADKIGDEFGVQYIIKGGGDEYQRLAEIKATNAPLILPIDFPKPYDVEDPYSSEYISTSDLKHWELAPFNPWYLNQNQIQFAITSEGCADAKTFLANLKKAVKHGLPEQVALKSLTETPAQLLKVNNQIGSLKTGLYANFIITDAPLFADESTILTTWVKGKPYSIHTAQGPELNGKYKVLNNLFNGYVLVAKKERQKTTYTLQSKDTLKLDLTVDNGMFQFKISLSKNGDSTVTGLIWPDRIDSSSYPFICQKLTGNVFLPGSSTPYPISFVWMDSLPNKSNKKDSLILPPFSTKSIVYPFTDYGSSELPKQGSYLLKNATIWTNEKDGILANHDLLIKDGKIKIVGKNLTNASAVSIDATGKYISAGIIDEHSHIAISNGVNEGTQSSSSEVRIGDVVNSEDINIYRQLSGGVVASQLLHGSANPIGGQSALVKLRWGFAPEQMKIAAKPDGSGGFIKFALGENVKQSNWGERNVSRYPQTRMGVEQVYYDAFIRAKEYEANLKKDPNTRRDLELDAIVEILNNKRYITCHSYVQSEINMLMQVADSMGFKVNTFTHILEGYKVADKMKAHQVSASTFADWWAYKYEVMEAIPYNAALLYKMGVNTAINSDDAEMGRRLNQEAAKAIKYGNVPAEEALKMVTLNPAKMLHLDDKMGSIKVGKDADIVVWSQPPLSIYAKAELTFVDGMLLFDREKDKQLQQQIIQERSRLIQKMLAAKQAGEKTEKKISKPQDEYHCDDE